MRNPFESPAPLSQVHPSLQIEDYLDHLCAPLLDKITYEQRLAIRDEVRAHLLVLIAGHEELGSSTTEATQAALRQFGEPKKIGRSLSRQYRHPFARNAPLQWVLLHAVLGGAVASLVFMLLDTAFQAMGITANTFFFGDCILGMASGWIPAVRFLKHPVSPFRAALRSGGYYTAIMTFLTVLFSLLSGFSSGRDPLIVLYFVTLTGAGHAVGGALMARLFQRLQRFAPRSKTLIAPN